MTMVLPHDVDAARRLTERIRLIAANVAENVEKLRELVEEARTTEAHIGLGYASWTAYLLDVFGDEPLRLARDVRQELVAELSAQGLSTRAIAPIVGVDHKTVHNDLRTVEISPVGPIVALDGREFPRPARAEPKADVSKELALVNDIRLYLRTLARSPQVARLSDGGKAHIITALQETISRIEGNQS